MERILACVHLTEPVLLVGETGTGKTTVVQHLAGLMNQKLIAVNLSQQSDSSDLLGGFKPVDGKALAFPLFETFQELFCATFNAEMNREFIAKAHKFFLRGKWANLVKVFKAAITKAGYSAQPQEPPSKQPRTQSHELKERWVSFCDEVASFEAQVDKLDNKLMFKFIEGTLVKAVRQGHWVLLDEINLATTETLECLSGLLQDKQGSLLLTEKGDSEEIPRHPNFRVFACMNPATDVGKRDLPPGLRNRFTEFYVHSPDTVEEDLVAIVKGYLDWVHGDNSAVTDVVNFYQHAKKLQRSRMIADGANQTPHYSIRTLSRALSHVRHTGQMYPLRRALYEGFCMTFATQLTKEGCHTVTELIKTHLLRPIEDIAQCLRFVPATSGPGHVQFREGSFWLPRGPEEIDYQAHTRYVITPSVQANIDNLARVVMSSKYPVLIQGPTSSGKTSMVEYLANCTGHRFVRINNHEHTDLQEYVGSYVSKDGRLQFQEGALVTALRHGHWIVLDELNLAPSDVLEALNRLLDDNRELLISETQEVVKPHKNFMLFATQNPAGLYGGRKALSRAFRNRFLELHFDEIPQDELETILTTRCAIAPSYCKLLVQVYAKLQARRQTTRVFESKEGFITLRDLFRWANRQAAGKEELAKHGYMLLAERVRKDEEKLIVKETLEEVIKVKIDLDTLYNCEQLPEYLAYVGVSGLSIAWTKAMQRLFSLVAACLRNHESVLLVGSTGCGKTTVCQMLASALGQTLRIVNCHQNTETSDLLGGQRPLRQQAALRKQLQLDLSALLLPILGDQCPIELEDLRSTYEALYKDKPNSLLWKSLPKQDADESIFQDLLQRCHQTSSLFEWHDGPLVQSMKEGGIFLLDEISLAEDSVLERLNSVLEPSRLLVLAEKCTEQVEQLTADGKFQFLATMNPGGDFGKKELSPALRNRFTEIWVPPVTDQDDLRKIIEEGLEPLPCATRPRLATAMLDFLSWFIAAVSPKVASSTSHQIVSLRDILSWTHFIVRTRNTLNNDALGFIHGGCLVFLDGLGSNSSLATSSANDPRRADMLRFQGLKHLVQCSGQEADFRDFCHFGSETINEALLYIQTQIQDLPCSFKVGPFPISKGQAASKKDSFAMNAPTTFDNMRRVLRALQISKPVMLEGSPGVGKTSLIQAIADRANRTLIRINLSEQTDLMDLFGTDLPREGGRSGEFEWRDAPFLSAMCQGHWVLLDEINLASQSVLEGLNSCLDHRGSVFVPELGRAFEKKPGFQVFAAQNPLQQGGGRKGLPRSFLNRFAQVHVQPLSMVDLQVICQQAYTFLPSDVSSKMLDFNHQLHEATMVHRRFGRQGSPWEFNLRDVFRWMDLLRTPLSQPQDYLDLIYLQRMRTPEDRDHVLKLFQSVFGFPYNVPKPDYHLDANTFSVGRSRLPRVGCALPVGDDLQLLQSQLPALEAVMKCVEMNWLAILVGPQGTGKTSLLNGLAQLVGRPLVEFAMNPGVDTMELLGGFEQMEPARYRQVAKAKLLSLVDDISDQCFEQSWTSHLDQVADIRHQLQRLNWDDVKASSLKHILSLTEKFTGSSIALQAAVDAAQQAVSALAELEGSDTCGRFEWVEGALIEAMENGHWFLIDNANLCHASVLDRLNPLLEPNGALMLHERGLDDNNEMRWVRPHKDFRIFLAMDPIHGELSRPMRNRGLEVVLPQSADWSSNPYDLHRIAAINNFPPSQAAQLIQAHNNAIAPGTQTLLPGAPRDFSFLCRWVAERVQRGSSFQAAIHAASITVYRQPLTSTISLEFPWILAPAPSSLLSRDAALYTLMSQASSLVSLLQNPGDGSAFWVSQVESAGLYFVMRATPDDADLRQRFLVWLGSQIQSSGHIAIFQHALSVLVGSAVFHELRSACETFCSQYLLHQFPDTMSPMDWVDSHTFYGAMLRGPVDLSAQFHQLLSKFQVAAALSVVEHQLNRATRYAESRMDRLSLLEQSYLSHQHNVLPEGAHGPLIKLFYPLVKSVHAYLAEWILPDTRGEVNEANVNALVRHLASLLSTLNSEQVKFARLSSLIKWISKALQSDADPRSQKVKEIAREILLKVGQDSHRSMKLIWKHLRYPVLRTAHLQHLKLDWFDALGRLDPYCNRKQLLFNPYSDSERQTIPTVIQALATLHLLEPNTPTYQAAVDTACSIVTDAVSKLQVHTSAPNSQGHLMTHLFAIVDHEGLSQESHLLAQVMGAANGLQTSPELLQDIQVWLKLSFHTSSRNILDFAAWQNIAWIVERQPLDRAMLRGFLIEQLLAWSHRAWHSSFNYISPQPVGSEELESSAGPPRLYQSLKTTAALQLLASFETFPLHSLRQYTHQVKRLTSTLHCQLADAPLMDQSSLNIAAGLLVQMILSFSKQLSMGLADEIHTRCQALMSQLSTLSSGKWYLSAKSRSQALGLGKAAALTADLRMALESIAYPSLKGAMDSYAIPALLHMYYFLDNYNKAPYGALGQMWICVGLGFLHTYIPKCPYDPVIKVQMKGELYQADAVRLQAASSVQQAIQLNYNGASSNTCISQLETSLVQVRSNIEKLGALMIPRPETSQDSEIYQDITYLQSNLLDPNALKALIDELQQGKPNAVAKEQSLQNSLEEVARCIQVKYPLYPDILRPIELALHNIRHGMRLCVYGSRQSEAPYLERFLGVLLAYPYQSGPGSSFMDDITADQVLDKVRHQFANQLTPYKAKAYGNLLIILVQRFLVDVAAKGWISPSDRTHLHNLFSEVAFLWNSVEECRRKEQTEKESLFRNKVQTTENVEDDDAALLEKEMRELFPSYEGDFDFDSEAPMSAPIGSFKEVDPAWASEVASLHGILASWLHQGRVIPRPATQPQKEHLLMCSYLAGAELQKGITRTPDWHLDIQLASSRAIALHLGWETLTNPLRSSARTQTLIDVVPYNFYHSPNTGEAQKILPVLSHLQSKVEALLEQWPEHAVLAELLVISKRIAQFSCQSPLMKLLTGLEMLLRKAQDWEAYASRQYSLSESLKEVTSLVVQWRQLELGSWPTLLDSILANFTASAHTWWLDLYNTILPCIKPEKVIDTLNTLDRFMRSSSLGEFGPRLDMLRSFALHLRASSDSRCESQLKLHNIVSNLVDYYLQFDMPAKDKIALYRKPIERELKGLVKVASWKDINIDALHQSAMKTHRALSRLSRKFRIHLASPISLIFNEVQANVTEPAYRLAPSAAEHTVTFDLVVPEHAVSTLAKMGSKALTSFVQRYKDKIYPMTRDPRVSPKALEGFLDEVLEQIQGFQKETVPEGKEERVAYIKTRRMIKKKALGDFWKQLKAMGLKYRSSVRSEQTPLELFEQPALPLFDAAWSFSQTQLDPSFGHLYGANPDWEKAQFYYQRILARLPHLQNCAHQPSPRHLGVRDRARPGVRQGHA
ncbi:AAA ATPase midasin [Entomophthora muscae]|uniref:AAA ATPase midasin n=1 Tax=Entomophthora muscae TaxID=34485 RepID=A0ACC2TQ24_9FUNG|nr:AAA ATPase midasin [Entomophthora muscae]